jgi:creatinine amidohydrolase
MHKEVGLVNSIEAKYLYADLKWPEVKQAVAEDRVVVLSVGSTEDHGYHLPLDTDAFIGWSIATEACKKSGCALLLPQMPFGFNDHHMDFLGTIAIKPDHLIDMICDITGSVAHHGFQRIVLVNSHGSNEPLLEIAARRTVIDEGILCATVGATALNGGVMSKVLTTAIHSHAEEFETSLYLHLEPRKVDMTKATKEERVQPSQFFWRGSRRDPVTGAMQSSPVKIMDWWSAYTESGVIGDATAATAEKGKAIFEASVEGLAAFLKEFQNWDIRPRVDYHDARRTRLGQKR